MDITVCLFSLPPSERSVWCIVISDRESAHFSIDGAVVAVNVVEYTPQAQWLRITLCLIVGSVIEPEL